MKSTLGTGQIESITQHRDLESSTEFRCAAGNVVVNVALSGRVAKFAG